MILYDEIRALSDTYETRLRSQVEQRVVDMEEDDYSHHILYQVLGVSPKEGHDIDVYQNKGRFLYKYAGAFLEDAAFMCINHKFEDAAKTKIPNTLGVRPKTFEIDALVDQLAFEIKWRDATTDGDHITKEHTRVQVIRNHGYKPIRVMFYYPQREQAIRIQQTLKTLYAGVEGEYYGGDEAWEYLKDYSGVDLKAILTQIANERTPENGN